jgi:hypothetical protein
VKTPTLFFSTLLFVSALANAAPVPLFDGKTFNGWEGETTKVWRIEDGVILGGSMEGNPQNEFLATKKPYRNFRLTLEYKLNGTEGFVNGGVQFRSVRIKQPPNEMFGYQADIGAGKSGCPAAPRRQRRPVRLEQLVKRALADVERREVRHEVVATERREQHKVVNDALAIVRKTQRRARRGRGRHVHLKVLA